MKLEPGERSILASFADGPAAEKALNELQQAGYTEVQMDRIGRFGYRPDEDLIKPAIHGNETSMARAVLAPDLIDDDTRVLMAAMPDASGMSGPKTVDGFNFLITVVTNEPKVSQAVTILEQNGGRV